MLLLTWENYGHVHIISVRFSFRFTELCGMMRTYFVFYIYVEYKFKSFEHHFNLFWWKIQPSEKNASESTAIVVIKNVERIQNWFFWTDDETQFLNSLADSNFGCYCGRSTSLIIISILRKVNVWIAFNEFIKIIITMSSSLPIFSLLLRILICINTILCSHYKNCTESHFVANIVSLGITF